MSTSSSSRNNHQPVGYRLRAFERRLAELERDTVRQRRSRAQQLAFASKVGGDPTHQFFFDRFVKLTTPEAPADLVEYALSVQDGSRAAAHNYLTHGLHSYKGKFFPQIVRSLINSAGLRASDAVVDPFVGSGTTTLEGSLLGFSSHGIDRNPLAALISETKVDALRLSAEGVTDARKAISAAAAVSRDSTLANEAYLSRWFPAATLKLIGRLLNAIDGAEAPPAFKNVARLVLSADLRSWSLQEPSQLRLFRRREAPPAIELKARFDRQLIQTAREIAVGIELLRALSIELSPATVTCGDSRDDSTWMHGKRKVFGALVTSPPYATALPYIDTDRLSIYALGLDAIDKRADLEWSMIGNREIRKGQRLDLEHALHENAEGLPDEIVQAIQKIRRANRRASVGFRRENLPALLYRYFADMKTVLDMGAARLRPDALCAIVVGDSYTVAGTRRVRIRTADHLCAIAVASGLRLAERIRMGGQAAYLPHQRNMIPGEEILLFRTPRAKRNRQA